MKNPKIEHFTENPTQDGGAQSTSVNDDVEAECVTPHPAAEQPPASDQLHIASGTARGGGNEPPIDTATTAEEPPDPFDLEQLRLSQDYGAELGVKKMVLTVPVDKPKPEWWVRVHPDDKYRIQTLLLNMKEDRKRYLIAPGLRQHLATEPMSSPQALFTGINRQGVVFIWPVRLPGLDGKIDAWSQSAMEAATLAMTKWVRMASNMPLGAYDVWETSAPLPEPNWPALPFKDLLRIAFKDAYIDSLDHPVLKTLRGEL